MAAALSQPQYVKAFAGDDIGFTSLDIVYMHRQLIVVITLIFVWNPAQIFRGYSAL